MKIYTEIKESITAKTPVIPLSKIVKFYPMEKKLEAFLKNEKIGVDSEYSFFSFLDFLKLVSDKFYDYEFIPLGKGACSIVYIKKQKNTFGRWAKIIFAVMVVFFGGALSIMTFHADVGMREVILNMKYFFGGSADISDTAGLIAYCIGVGAGFLFVSNAFKSKKNKKPSLIELDIEEFDGQVSKLMEEKKDDDN